MSVYNGKKNTAMHTEYCHFGEAMPDGRLSEPSDGKIYRLKEAISLVEKKGRMLTEAELKKFEV